MKIRMDRKTYAAAQRIADAKNMTFLHWAFMAIKRYRDSADKPIRLLEPLTRENSTSVAVSVPDGSTVTPKRIRECIAIELDIQNNYDNVWPYRYDRSSLDAVVQLETFLGKSCDYEQAEQYIDRRLSERKAELAAEAKHTKKGRK
jgi:Zn-finger nucleic acid-binding protein